jgi:predicted RNA polymerase sigma factor
MMSCHGDSVGKAALAAALQAEADALAMEEQARRADWQPLVAFYRERANAARATVVKLEREQAATVKAWVGAKCGRQGHGG